MSKWDAVQVAFEIARETEESYERTAWIPPYHAAEGGGPPIPDHITTELDRLTDVRFAAEDVLIATPSPDLSAAIWKIEYARKRWEDFEDWPGTWWEAVLGDLRRLAA